MATKLISSSISAAPGGAAKEERARAVSASSPASVSLVARGSSHGVVVEDLGEGCLPLHSPGGSLYRTVS